jgi:hypothetical protein
MVRPLSMSIAALRLEKSEFSIRLFFVKIIIIIYPDAFPLFQQMESCSKTLEISGKPGKMLKKILGESGNVFVSC